MARLAGAPRWRAALPWAALALALAIPLVVAAYSPLLAWRRPVYILAGFAGIVGLGPLLVQPLLIGGALPGLQGLRGRRAHRRVGLALIAAILVHVAGLWITSPPDVIDALLFRSPTPFSIWGVTAMWAAFAAALVAGLRRRLRPRLWRAGHGALAATVAIGTAVHAWQIEGTMGTISKFMLCALALGATAWALVRLRSLGWPRRAR